MLTHDASQSDAHAASQASRQNPNRLRALADEVIALDPRNPTTAARLVQPLCAWRRYDGARQALMREGLERIPRPQPQHRRDGVEEPRLRVSAPVRDWGCPRRRAPAFGTGIRLRTLLNALLQVERGVVPLDAPHSLVLAGVARPIASCCAYLESEAAASQLILHCCADTFGITSSAIAMPTDTASIAADFMASFRPSFPIPHRAAPSSAEGRGCASLFSGARHNPGGIGYGFSPTSPIRRGP